jgi:hypothetical protein
LKHDFFLVQDPEEETLRADIATAVPVPSLNVNDCYERDSTNNNSNRLYETTLVFAMIRE